VEGAVEVEVVVAGDGAFPLALAAELAPGCSFATTTPMSAVPPTAARAAERVKRRKRTWVRTRVSGELRSRACLIGDGRPFRSEAKRSFGTLLRYGAGLTAA
jgi:hypothetical protein